jgi:hypothetical protein
MAEDPKLYRKRAEAERQIALSSALENERGKASHAAARWDELADSAERVKAASAIRDRTNSSAG